ncbi:MAG: hypothetical protein AAF321_07325 [Pseudomonadota bacterium]
MTIAMLKPGAMAGLTTLAMASPAFAHENAADHALLAQDSLLGAFAHQVFGAHHAAETVGILVLGLCGAAALVAITGRVQRKAARTHKRARRP